MAGFPSTEDRIIAELARIADMLDAMRELLLRSLPAVEEQQPPDEGDGA